MAHISLSFLISILLSCSVLVRSAKHGNNPVGKADLAKNYELSSSKYIPHTGDTRKYDWTISRGRIAPDGITKDALLVNQQFPGPTIEANWGDWIEVTVHNNITGPEEGAALHWHGIGQQGTPWADGSPGVTQCPIAPGHTFKYLFRADKYGSSWWHSHYSASYTAGLTGAMVIYGPQHAHYDIDVGPVQVGDWYHRPYLDVVADAAAQTEDFNIYVPKSDNSLINGKNGYNCTLTAANQTAECRMKDLAKFNFQKGKSHLLRLVNTGAAAAVHFSIDDHTMEVVANDFTPLQPYKTDVVMLHIGQRADVIVRANGNPKGAYWMRSNIALNCSVTTNAYGKGVVLYEDADKNEMPKTKIGKKAAAIDDKSVACRNDNLELTKPLFSSPVDESPALTETVDIELFTNATGSHIWLQNNHTQVADYNDPVLIHVAEGNDTHPKTWDSINLKKATGKAVRIVINTDYQATHPMHLHGHDFQVLSEGFGHWDGKTIINPSNPNRRDTHILPRYGHLVIQFVADNPGVWLYHCHIAWHSSMGMNLALLEQPDRLQNDKKLRLPKEVHETCKAWDKWTKGIKVDQIDSGV